MVVQLQKVPVRVECAADDAHQFGDVEFDLKELVDVLVVHVQCTTTHDLEHVWSCQPQVAKVVFVEELLRCNLFFALELSFVELCELVSDCRPQLLKRLYAELLEKILCFFGLMAELPLDHLPDELDVFLRLAQELLQHRVLVAQIRFDHGSVEQFFFGLLFAPQSRAQLRNEVVRFLDPGMNTCLHAFERVDFFQLHEGYFSVLVRVFLDGLDCMLVSDFSLNVFIDALLKRYIFGFHFVKIPSHLIDCDLEPSNYRFIFYLCNFGLIL